MIVAKRALGLAVGSITVAFLLSSFRRHDLLSVTRGAIINSISDSILVVDGDDRIVDMNPAAERLVGKPASQAIGKPLEQSLPELGSIWTCANKSGEVTLDHENTPRIFDLRVSAIQDWQGRIASQVIVLRDITERKRVEEEIRKLNEELEQRVVERTARLEAAYKELESFFYSISHDLRAPLRAIDGFACLLQQDPESHLPPEALRRLKVIRDNARQMGGLVDGLLTYVRLGRQPLEKRSVAPAELARQALESLRHEQEGRQIEIVVGELPTCRGDAALLRQVWINLLSNAQVHPPAQGRSNRNRLPRARRRAGLFRQGQRSGL